jgi:hypothetical protein
MPRWATSEYHEILRDNLVEYTKADHKKRVEIIKEIKERIRRHAQNAQKSPPDELTQVIKLQTLVPIL